VKSRQSERGLYDAGIDEARQRVALVSGEVPVAVYGLGRWDCRWPASTPR